MAPIDPVRRLPEKAARAEAIGCEGYVSTWLGFGKGQVPAFEDFMTANRRQKARGEEPKPLVEPLLPKTPQKRSFFPQCAAMQARQENRGIRAVKAIHGAKPAPTPANSANRG